MIDMDSLNEVMEQLVNSYRTEFRNRPEILEAWRSALNLPESVLDEVFDEVFWHGFATGGSCILKQYLDVMEQQDAPEQQQATASKFQVLRGGKGAGNES